MGPLRESSKQEQKTQLEKEVSRSRIPRLVLRPQQKTSPASESPFSEEESREFNPPSSSGGSRRTVSSNSFCSDDTGCPSSQSVSPVKTPSDAGNSPISFCTGSDGDFCRKKFSPGTMSEGNPQLNRSKKETKTSLVKPGSEADFSSSGSTGSISAPEVHLSAAGSKKSSFSRKRSGRYNNSCDNHNIKPQSPEQYLTPLQQKEVTVRHLKTKLKESESKLKEREKEIEELKAQLGRMREDWIEEECNRVEAELALKEAKSEIKQLKVVIETMKNSMAEKDKKMQKYFLDINIQNKKLESLLQSMEVAQHSFVQDEQHLEYTCDLEGKPLAVIPDSLITGEQALEEVADSGLLLNEDTANETDSCEESLTTRTSVPSDPVPSNPAVNKEMLENALDEKLASPQEEEKSINMMVEKAIQTDVVPYSLDVEQFFQSIFSAQDTYPLSPPSSLKELDEFSLGSFTDSAIAVDLTPSDPNSVILLSPMESPCRLVQRGVNENRFMKELDFIDPPDDDTFRYAHASSQIDTKRSYWSSSPLTDVLALAVPVIPTVMWAFSTHRGGTEPIYNIGTLLRGCCLVALCSLRRTPFRTKI
ncbi:syntabulin isoform X1 [Pezoporus wallicus]|uniref:syntabulin isoform X1 n=1 Tax=Pezoporus wallicus TaxID=35540 RepID=UPI00254D312D|nr:syntabulin isoform X1 [Pezoporus wallicus]XP_061303834.1 syntabulin isoform X1 [Pezoporus flaviventris]